MTEAWARCEADFDGLQCQRGAEMQCSPRRPSAFNASGGVFSAEDSSSVAPPS